MGDMGSGPGSGRSPGEGDGNHSSIWHLEGYRPWDGKRVGCELVTKQQQREERICSRQH